jgi:diadenosine tetraphosphate (Ap4A) HIT family hydrolase
VNVSVKLAGCELCEHDGGRLVHHETDWRVVGVDDPEFPAFYRVVCNRHVAEFSELDPAERERCMVLVDAVERVLLEHLRPAKVNLASLGNVTPHLHWHVVARFDWDSRFPNPIWGAVLRAAPAERLAAVAAERHELDRLMVDRLRYA